MTKRKIFEIEDLSEETKKLYGILNEGSDLAVILIASSFLDACLGSLIKKRLRKGRTTEGMLDSSKGGALGSYAARANMCYALALIDKPERSDLLKIAEIRNLSAHHHLMLSFTSESIRAECEKLSYLSSLGLDFSIFNESMKNPRNKFTLTSVILCNRLLLTGLGLNTKRAQPI